MAIERIPITSREQWLGLRRRDVTASTIGALFGLHPYQTIAGLHAEKLGMDLPGPDAESAIIRRGNALERVVADEVAKLRPGWKIAKNEHYLRDAGRHLGGTPDFLVTDGRGRRGVLQTKTVGSYKFKREWGEPDQPTPPFWITLQNAAEIILEDAEFGAIGVLAIGDWTFESHVIEIKRIANVEDRIYRAVARFWATLDAGEVPVIDYERDADLVKLLYPVETTGKTVDLRTDNRIGKLLDMREEQASLIKEAEMRKVAAETEIRAKLGDAEFAMVSGWKVSLRTTHMPEQARKASSFRVLRAKRERV